MPILITGGAGYIRLTRSFDESSHSYFGYALKIIGFTNDVDKWNPGKKKYLFETFSRRWERDDER